MIITPALNAQSVGTGTNIGDSLLPQRINLDSASTHFSVSLRVTNGADNYGNPSGVTAYYACSPHLLSPAQATAQLRRFARYLTLPGSPINGDINAKSSIFEPVIGQYLYIWLSVPTVNTAQTVDVMVTEISTSASPQANWRTTFASVIANNIDTNFWSLLQTGAGQSVNQSSGNLVITAGTTANGETIIRSLQAWSRGFNLRFGGSLSQRIANNNFYIELVDVIGDGLAYSITNSTTVVITIPNNPFTSANVGQAMWIGVITGAAGIPMKATIASVSGNNVTYTVAGWPGSGSGTCSVFGWNYHHVLFDGTTATNAKYDAQRNGWATGDTTATINTTAAPGTVIQVTNDASISSMADSLAASTVTPAFVTRASRMQNIPPDGVALYLQIRCTNGTTNPASGTTWTLNFVGVEDFSAQPVNVGPSKLLGAAGLPVTVQGGTLPTITTITTLTTLANGQTAHSSASTGSPVRVGGRVVSTLDTTLVQGDASDLAVTTGQQLVTKDFATGENDWSYAAASGGILNTTTAVTVKAAGAANIRNYITGITLMAEALTNATEFAIRDGAAGTVLWRIKIPTGGLPSTSFTFPNPLRGSAATLVEIVTLTASGAGAVYANLTGYQSF